MKTSRILALIAFAFAGSALHAADADKKLDAAKKLVERITPAQPPCVSTGTARTAEQAIREYKASGPANPGGRGLKINPVPSPSR